MSKLFMKCTLVDPKEEIEYTYTQQNNVNSLKKEVTNTIINEGDIIYLNHKKSNSPYIQDSIEVNVLNNNVLELIGYLNEADAKKIASFSNHFNINNGLFECKIFKITPQASSAEGITIRIGVN